ncbi:MAG: tRNA-dihydrouridine synthase [Candidatus Shapirobacteria bacterium]|nr:tRNA-dihydrouridine synthase [Candidatus Shapirobacteria bacterium]
MAFWKGLSKPIVGLAPMDGVTDQAMRFITAKYGQPAVIFTEFINVEHVAAKPQKLFNRFWFSAIERPIVAQLSGVTPNLFYQLAFVAAYLGFDGVDLNMGCPSRSITHRGGGAGLIGNQELVKEIVFSVRRGLDDWEKGKKIETVVDGKILLAAKATKERSSRVGIKTKKRQKPDLSIKTRPGIKKPIIKDWLGFLASLPVEAIILHGRVLSCGHSGPVDWPIVAQAAEIVHQEGKILLGNGGIKSFKEAKEITNQYRLDGVLIGRGAMGNPWVFDDKKPDKEERFLVMMDHVRYYLDLFGQDNFLDLRKHLAWYSKGFPGASKLRSRLVRVNCYADIERIIGQK